MSVKNMPKLNDPITIRNVKVKNRLWYPPMLSFSSNADGTPGDDTYVIYEQKARGGAGLIMYEATSVDPNSFIPDNSYIGTDENIPAFKKLTDLLHKHDVKVGIQLAENGIIHIMAKVLTGVETNIIGPSTVEPLVATSAFTLMMPNWEKFVKDHDIIIREMTKKDIIHFEDQFALAAKRAVEAGFDFVEIHSAHATLHASFLAPCYNKRTDEYGGSLENRMRFLLETIEKVRNNVGETPIFVRISADELLDDDGLRIEDSVKIAPMLEKAGVDCIDVSQGNMIRSTKGIQIPTYYEEGAFIHLAEAIKKVVSIPVIGVGRIVKPTMADQFIQQGKADIIYMGRQLICDSDTPNKYFSEQLDDIKYCMGCLQGCNISPQVCVFDAFSGRKFKTIEPATEPKKVIILGAGIAGLEAARVAKLRGLDVSIYEKTDKIGGIMPIVAKEYMKKDFMNIVHYLDIQVKKLKVPIHFNKELSREEIEGLNPDVLIIACGSTEFLPDELKDNPRVITQEEAILKTKKLGKNLVLRGLNTYWKGGTESAITLNEEGYNIKAIIGAEPMLAADIMLAAGRRLMVMEYIEEKKIPVFRSSKNIIVTDNVVKFTDGTGKEQSIEFDNYIYCGGRRPAKKDMKSLLKGVAPKIEFIGDAKKPADIQAAIKTAEATVRKI